MNTASRRDLLPSGALAVDRPFVLANRRRSVQESDRPSEMNCLIPGSAAKGQEKGNVLVLQWFSLSPATRSMDLCVKRFRSAR